MNALIVSLNFNPGHVSHMVASYKQCEELGYEVMYYTDSKFKNFLPLGSRILQYGIAERPKVDLAVFLFPSQKNLKMIWEMKRQGTKIVYIFHEPLATMMEYRKCGFSYTYLAKLWIINRISSLTVNWSDVILLPSKKAVQLYEKNSLYKNNNYHYLPLMYDDECKVQSLSNLPRKYFSYIGTIAADHSFSEFLDFVCWAIRENRLLKLNFLIATKSDFELPDELKNSKRVTIQKGRPLKNEEINNYYSSTYVVWNAYARTTQSGVLAKSFMFGTPAIVLKKNLSEYTKDGLEVVAINDNKKFEEIDVAINDIIDNFSVFSLACRKRFMETFYYKVYNQQMKKILDI